MSQGCLHCRVCRHFIGVSTCMKGFPAETPRSCTQFVYTGDDASREARLKATISRMHRRKMGESNE